MIEKAVGGSGNDTINGNAYDNILVGGPSNDLITGGPGADRFVLGAPSHCIDTFFDFAYYQGDRIALDHVGFGLSGIGSLAAAGVNFVYAFCAAIARLQWPSARRPDHHRIWQRRVLGSGRCRRQSRCVARPCLRPGDTLPPVTRSSPNDVIMVDPETGVPESFKVAQLTQYDFMII